MDQVGMRMGEDDPFPKEKPFLGGEREGSDLRKVGWRARDGIPVPTDAVRGFIAAPLRAAQTFYERISIPFFVFPAAPKLSINRS